MIPTPFIFNHFIIGEGHDHHNIKKLVLQVLGSFE